jgi:hypothetical protein
MSDHEDARTQQPPHPRSERLRLWMAALGPWAAVVTTLLTRR